eukprot:TRINITY_DN16429_c0_g1_i1.p1 TRINITY_DN16429_c0_g1~~TRINITY_DN16429_c0_g1_i1.p1  ORF type:complete len:265 (-),score=25.12 TRINITY_DN16429_c0_g1_i1:108-833(-)
MAGGVSKRGCWMIFLTSFIVFLLEGLQSDDGSAVSQHVFVEPSIASRGLSNLRTRIVRLGSPAYEVVSWGPAKLIKDEEGRFRFDSAGRLIKDSKGRFRFWQKPVQKKSFLPKKERLAALGTAGALSYSLLKGLKHALITAIAWYLVAVRNGLPPPRKWTAFAATYAAVYAASTPIQPIKWAAIAAMTPRVRRLIESLASRLSISQKASSGMLFLCTLAISGTVWASGIVIASALAGVPVW